MKTKHFFNSLTHVFQNLMPKSLILETGKFICFLQNMLLKENIFVFCHFTLQLSVLEAWECATKSR